MPLFSPSNAPDGSAPWLPKTCATTEVVVLDVSREAKDPDTLFALATLQGVVNRTCARKVFLDYPLRDPSHPGVAPLRAWFEDGLIPYPSRRPALREESPHPALDWMLREHGGLLRGMVLTPPRTREAEGCIAAATAACAFEDAIALSERLAEELRGEGWSFALRGDTRGLDNLAALRWTLDRYGSDPRRCTRLMGFTHGGRPTYMVDYWVATRCLCFYLDARLAEEAAASGKILRPEIAPPGTILYGDVEGTCARRVTQQLGYTVSAGDLCNLSVTSSIPSAPARICHPPAPRALPAEPDAAYVSWNGFDGDNPVGAGAYGYLALREAPAEADAPFGMWFHPHMVDLFPTMAEWWSRRAGANLDVVASMNDGGVAPWTEEGRRGWREAYRSVLERSNGLFQVFNVFYETEENVREAIAGPLGWPFAILGYNSEHYLPEEGPTRWRRLGGTVYCNQGCPGGGEAGAASIRRATEASPAGEPVFVMAQINGPHGCFLERATEAMRALRANPTAGRRLVFLPPRDLAATWRAWAETARPAQASSVWPGPNGLRFRPTPLRPDASVPFRPRPVGEGAGSRPVVRIAADLPEDAVSDEVKRLRAAAGRPAWWVCGEAAPLDRSAVLAYALRVAALRRAVEERPEDRVAVPVALEAGTRAEVLRYHLLEALEVAAPGSVDAFFALGPEPPERLRLELEQFAFLRPAAVLAPPRAVPPQNLRDALP